MLIRACRRAFAASSGVKREPATGAAVCLPLFSPSANRTPVCHRTAMAPPRDSTGMARRTTAPGWLRCMTAPGRLRCMTAPGWRRAAASPHRRATASGVARCRVLLRSGSLTMRDMAVPTRRVLLAKPRGYCAGVDRAVQTVEMALERHGAPVYVRKQIVHNKHVVASLEKRGAVFVEETADVPEGAVVVFSA